MTMRVLEPEMFSRKIMKKFSAKRDINIIDNGRRQKVNQVWLSVGMFSITTDNNEPFKNIWSFHDSQQPSKQFSTNWKFWKTLNFCYIKTLLKWLWLTLKIVSWYPNHILLEFYWTRFISVATAKFSTLFKLMLCRWRGSVFKLLWKDLLLYLALFYSIHFLYWSLMSPEYQKLFVDIVNYFKNYDDVIPLSFVLGFFVSNVMTRW